MSYNGIMVPEIGRLSEEKELKELRKLLSLRGDISEGVVMATWNFLKKMQQELDLPTLSPIKQHYYFFQKLKEIRRALNLSLTFTQLNQLYVEITTLRDLLGLPEITPISEIISIVQREALDLFASLDNRADSLLFRILLLQSTSSEQSLMGIAEQPILKHDLDRILLEILKAYGPLSRPELVQLTDVARSTIYDSLTRLITKGFVIQYSKKKNPVGRPITFFDAVL
ncbi:MAG: hypothetical protein ACFFAE_21520 [Candidatus Hodarchaeota archaeon]